MYPEQLKQQAVKLCDGRSAGQVLKALQKEFPNEEMPTERTIRRWRNEKATAPMAEVSKTPPTNWIDDWEKQYGELPPIPDFMARLVEDYLPGARVSKGMKLKEAPPSAQFWNHELLHSQRDKVLQLVEWLGQNREDYQEMIKRYIPGSPPSIRVVPKQKAS